MTFAFIAVDFYNEISLLWGMVCVNGIPTAGTGEGFPPGYEYSWADGIRIKKPIPCSGPQYVDFVLNWIEETINNDSIFPATASKQYLRRIV